MSGDTAWRRPGWPRADRTEEQEPLAITEEQFHMVRAAVLEAMPGADVFYANGLVNWSANLDRDGAVRAVVRKAETLARMRGNCHACHAFCMEMAQTPNLFVFEVYCEDVRFPYAEDCGTESRRWI